MTAKAEETEPIKETSFNENYTFNNFWKKLKTEIIFFFPLGFIIGGLSCLGESNRFLRNIFGAVLGDHTPFTSIPLFLFICFFLYSLGLTFSPNKRECIWGITDQLLTRAITMLHDLSSTVLGYFTFIILWALISCAFGGIARDDLQNVLLELLYPIVVLCFSMVIPYLFIYMIKLHRNIEQIPKKLALSFTLATCTLLLVIGYFTTPQPTISIQCDNEIYENLLEISKQTGDPIDKLVKNGIHIVIDTYNITDN